MIPIKQENAHFLNYENIEVTIGKKKFVIKPIKLVEFGEFQAYWSLAITSLQGLFANEWFIDTEKLDINKTLLIKHGSNKLLLQVTYELLKRQCFQRRFFPEIFDINENDNLLTVLLKIPLKFIYYLLNIIQIKIFWNLSYVYFVRKIEPEQFAIIWYGTMLINVEGVKKKVDLIKKDSETFFQVKPLSITNLFPGHKTIIEARIIQKEMPDGTMGRFDTKTSQFLSDSTSLRQIMQKDKIKTSIPK